MALSIHTNYSSLVTQNQLGKTNSMLSSAMERLGTGLRINSAADDAAGLQIAVRLQSQSNGLKTAMRNAQDGISMLQTGEGAFDEITNITHRMKDLATQGANGTNGTNELKALNSEFAELAKELTSIMTNTEYSSGTKLLTGGKLAGAMNLQIGASSAEVLAVDANVEMTAVADKLALLAAGDLTTGAAAAMTLADDMMTAVGEVRGKFGSYINRLEHTVNNLGNMNQNVELSKGRIMDADFAAESANMTKNQMLMQSGMSVLSKANQTSGMVMSLLR